MNRINAAKHHVRVGINSIDLIIELEEQRPTPGNVVGSEPFGILIQNRKTRRVHSIKQVRIQLLPGKINKPDAKTKVILLIEAGNLFEFVYSATRTGPLKNSFKRRFDFQGAHFCRFADSLRLHHRSWKNQRDCGFRGQIRR